MNLPFMKFYVRDWQADPELRMCSLEARGLWIELLCIMHNAKRRGFLETPQGVQLDDEQTSRLIGAFKDDLYRCKAELLVHGIPSVDEETGIWYCRRMVKETLKAQKCSDAGRSGGGNPILNKENKEDIPDTRHHISLKETFKGGSKTDFDKFWKAYPKKKSKGQAEKAFKKIGVDVEVIIASVEKQKQTLDWKKEGGQYIPHPATYLNARGWEDELSTDVKKQPSDWVYSCQSWLGHSVNKEGLTPQEFEEKYCK